MAFTKLKADLFFIMSNGGTMMRHFCVFCSLGKGLWTPWWSMDAKHTIWKAQFNHEGDTNNKKVKELQKNMNRIHHQTNYYPGIISIKSQCYFSFYVALCSFVVVVVILLHS